LKDSDSSQESHIRAIEVWFLKPVSLLDWPLALFALYKHLWLLASALFVVGFLIGVFGSQFHPERSPRELSQGTSKFVSPISEMDAYRIATKAVLVIAFAALVCTWHYTHWYWGLAAYFGGLLFCLCLLGLIVKLSKKGT
jgi:hypothetical protein